MGVKGLWRLINSCGTPVPLESLEHKILAVDVSIWLHQAVRGFKGYGNISGSNAHLLTLFHRICKLLFYRIRPVFVFDGGVPQLKKQTLSSRRLKREAAASKAQKIRERLLTNLLRSQAVRTALGKKGPGPSLHHIAKPIKKDKDMFELPPLSVPFDAKSTKVSSATSVSDSEDEEDFIMNKLSEKNIHDFEFESSEFKSLPLDIQHEILSELQVTRKENSWHTINEMPQKSNSFSSFQMDRLLKRRKFQDTLHGIQSEIRKKHSAELEAQLFGELEQHVSQTHRIISEDSAHSILVKRMDTDVLNASETIGETIRKEGKKASQKTSTKKDFLTELSKQGIVSSVTNKPTKRNFDSQSSSDASSDYDSDSSFEDKLLRSPSKKKRKMEEVAFLQAVDFVLEDNDISQEEILSLIKQSQMEAENEDNAGTSIHSSNTLNGKKVENLDKPSTSMNAPGTIYNSDAESSTDDEDFVDVPDSNSLEQTFTDTADKSSVAQSNPANDIQEDFQSSKENNIDVILGAKTDSLYIKILQQRLDSIVNRTQNITSPTKSLVDTRKASPSKSKNETPVSPPKGVTVNLDFIDKPKLKQFEKDIFQDVFPIQKEKSSASQECSSQNSRVNDTIDSDREKEPVLAFVKTKSSEETKIEENISKALAGIEFTDQLKEKITELLKIEIEKTLKESLLSSKTAKATNSLKSESDKLPTKMCSTDIDDDTSNVNECTEKIDINERKYIVQNSKETFVPETTIVEENFKGSIPSKKELSANEDDINYSSSSKIKSTVNNEDVFSNFIKTEADKQKSKVSPTIFVNAENVDPNWNEKSTSGIMTPLTSIEEETVARDNSVPLSLHGSNQQAESEPSQLSINKLKVMETDLENEQRNLVAKVQSAERVAVDLSDQIYGDAQELLRVFGIPYLIAPMEAESQCAFLDEAGLTHGTITDDSDIFLFGGKKAYKNFFNHSKHVECFKSENIHANMGLDRSQLVALALLTGSDYTVGIDSVGSVLGMEILSEFPGKGLECLKSFKKWWNIASKNVSSAQASKVRQRLTLLHLPESFPNENIYKAYLQPDIDLSKEKFSWMLPDIDKLRRFTTEKFGWNQSKTDEIIIPVFKKLGLKDTQMHIESYFSNIKLVKEPQNKSKRLQEAIARTKRDGSSALNTHDQGDAFTSNDGSGCSNEKVKTSRKRALLIDPSEGKYQNNAKQRKTKGKNSELDKKKEGKGNKATNQPSSKSLIESESEPKEELTKEEKKLLIYKKLQEKERILQSEKERQIKEEKKALAAVLLAQKKSVKKRQK